MPDVCTAADLGNVLFLEVNGEQALSDIDSTMTSDINAILANSKGNPNSNCYLMGRQTVNWSFNFKVPGNSTSSIFNTIWVNHLGRTPVSVVWGPFNGLLISASVYITNISPTVTDETMMSATMSGVTQGEISASPV